MLQCVAVFSQMSAHLSDTLHTPVLADDALVFLPTRLECIALAATRIGDAGVKILASRCARTHSLDLAANQITDAGGVALASLLHLRSLNLVRTLLCLYL